MELVRGNVADRPWALTLATVVRRGVTGEVTLVSDHKQYTIAFDRGVIVAARSPITTDGAIRVALTSHLISPSQVSGLNRRMTASPEADEIDLLGEVAKLSPAQLDKLRTEVTTRRAARTFAPEHGEFTIEDRISLPACACAVDIRAVVYYGVRMHVSDARLSDELRTLGGSYFVLDPDAAPDLAKFGFCDGEAPMLDALREGITIPELEARHRDIDPRAMLAAIYALVACGAVQVAAPPRAPSAVVPGTQTATIARPPSPPPSPRTSPPPPPARTSPPPVPTPSPPIVARTAIPRGRRASNAPPYVALARGTQDSVQPPAPPKTNPELAAEAADRASRALAADKPEAAVLDLKKAVELVPNDVDYKALLGWALFCAADDKAAIATESRKLLERAVYKSQRPEVAQFYLGRVERMLGRDREALRHFQAVLDAQPDHRDASAEVRILEARLKRLGISLN